MTQAREHAFKSIDNAEIQHYFYRDFQRETTYPIVETPQNEQTELWTTTLRGNNRGMTDRSHQIKLARQPEKFVSERGRSYLLRLQAAEASQALYQQRKNARRKATPKKEKATPKIASPEPAQPEVYTVEDELQLQALRRRQASLLYANRGAVLSPRMSAPYYDTMNTQVASGNEWPTRSANNSMAYSRQIDDWGTPRRIIYEPQISGFQSFSGEY